MPGLLYVETNYVIGVAEGRCPSLFSETERRGLPPLQLVIPTPCILEAFSVLESLRKKTLRFRQDLDERINEFGRDRESNTIADLLSSLDSARTSLILRFDEVEARLRATLAELADGAEMFDTGPEVIRDSLSTTLIEKDPTDNLILHAILRHARTSTVREKGFLSENSGDYGAARVKAELRQAGIRHFATPEGALGWFQSLRRREG